MYLAISLYILIQFFSSSLLRKNSKTTIKGYIFKFYNKIYTQKESAISDVSIASDVANLFIVWWDGRFKEKLTENSINVTKYSHYLDDINIETNTSYKTLDTVGDLEANTMESI